MDINYSLLLSIFYVKTRNFVNKKFFDEKHIPKLITVKTPII